MVAFARPALGCAHTVGLTDVFIARDGPPRANESENTEEALSELKNYPSGMHGLVKGLDIDGK